MSDSRFDNVSTTDLLEREQEASREIEDLRLVIRRRLIAESGIIAGKIYRVASDGKALSGRLIWVHGVNAGQRGIIGHKRFYCFASGRMNGRSAAGDGWTIRCQNVDVERLTLHGDAP